MNGEIQCNMKSFLFLVCAIFLVGLLAAGFATTVAGACCISTDRSCTVGTLASEDGDEK